MRFELKQETVEFRGEKYRIRELKQVDRSAIAKAMQKDPTQGPLLYVSTCCVEPTFTVDEVKEAPAGFVELIVGRVNVLSEIQRGGDGGKND